LLTTATEELSTVDHIINFDVKYQSFIIVGHITFHEDDEAILGGIKQDCNDKATREAARMGAVAASMGRSSLQGMPRTTSIPHQVPPHCCRSCHHRWRRRRRRRRRRRMQWLRRRRIAVPRRRRQWRWRCQSITTREEVVAKQLLMVNPS
jgi:hypothetical protein